MDVERCRELEPLFLEYGELRLTVCFFERLLRLPLEERLERADRLRWPFATRAAETDPRGVRCTDAVEDPEGLAPRSNGT